MIHKSEISHVKTEMEEYMNSKGLTLVYSFGDREGKIEGLKITYDPTSGDYTVLLNRATRHDKIFHLIVSSKEQVIGIFKMWFRSFWMCHSEMELVNSEGEWLDLNFITIGEDIDTEDENFDDKLEIAKTEEFPKILQMFIDLLNILSATREIQKKI